MVEYCLTHCREDRKSSQTLKALQRLGAVSERERIEADMSEEILKSASPLVEDAPANPVPEPAAEVVPAPEPEAPEESFGEAFADFERTHSRKADAGDGPRQIDATVVTIDAEQVVLDIGFKTEGVLARTTFPNNGDDVKPGDRMLVSVVGRNEEGYYELSRIRLAQPTDWSALQKAFAEKTPVSGTVTAVVKGGLTVDVGVRAFMPASRTGTRDAAELAELVGKTITCNIIKLDTEDEDVVVDRRSIVEAQAKEQQQARFATLQEGDVVTGQVRSLTSYGAFVDLGGMDGLLHISDISWSRVNAPEDVLQVGQELQLKVLKLDADGKRISLGLKQMGAEPWDSVPEKYIVGQRVTGTVTRLMDFGAFVELEPGVEGLIHVSEMSWVKKVRKPSDMLKTGDTVEAVVLNISPAEKRISLGLKQALGDPWTEVPLKFPVGAEVEGPVTRLMNFGAFVQIAEGIEGLVHISEIVADRRLNHPSDVLRVGQVVKAQVLDVDAEKRQIKLSMKQLLPTGLSEYLEEHKAGDTVSGRVVDLTGDVATIELGEGIRAVCKITKAAAAEQSSASSGGIDLSAFSSMLKDRWKTGGPAPGSAPAALEAGQVRGFKITVLDADAKKIELQLA
jgi:small subunit ribosomal protein S1